MTERTEPKLNTGLAFLGLGSKKEKDHSELLNEALGAFTEAQEKLEAAQATIAAQIEADEKEVAIRQGKILSATESHSRLERVKARFADLLA